MIKSLIKNNAYTFSVIWALIILALCSMPGRFIPSTTWLELLSFDKFVHAGIFFVLVSLLGVSVEAHQQQKNLFFIYVALSVLYGGALEIMQATVFSERSADLYDMIANSFGCLVGAVASRKINALIFK